MKSSLISDFLSSVQSDLYQDSLSKPAPETATAMRIVGGPKELVKPLNVGLMFFNEKPSSFFSYARIEVIDKPDPTGEGMTEKYLKDLLTANCVIRSNILKIMF